MARASRAVSHRQRGKDPLQAHPGEPFLAPGADVFAEQIADLSGKFTLRPGDVIATGSPSGNGRPRGIFLEPGQDLTVEIEGIGTLHNLLVQGE